MNCFEPVLVPAWDRSAQAKESSKEGNWTGAVKSAKETMLVPCGSCPACYNRRSMDWQFRIREEKKNYQNSDFLTLTYSDDNLVYGKHAPTLVKSDLQTFNKNLKDRIRRFNMKHEGNRGDLKDFHPDMVSKYLYYGINPVSSLLEPLVKMYCVGEYGGQTQRPHYHGIYLGIPPKIRKDLPEIWDKGHIKIGTVTDASIAYCTSYIINRQTGLDGKQDEFNLQSKFIGASYEPKTTKYHLTHIDAKVRVDGNFIAMPRYIKNKIFTPEERSIIGDRGYQHWNDRRQKKEAELLSQGLNPQEVFQQDIDRRRREFSKLKKVKTL